MRYPASMPPMLFIIAIALAGCEAKSGGKEPKRDLDGFTDLHVAAEAMDMDRVSELLLHGADPNVKDFNGVTPLHRAARDGHAELVSELVRYSADLDAKTSTGWTPLHLAIRAGNVEMVSLLLGYGASPHVALPGGKTPLIYAAERGDANIANLLIAMGSSDGKMDIDARDAQGNSALLIAAQRGNSDLAVSLLASGADANVRNKNQQTPLHFAIANDDVVLAGVLLESGADMLAQGPGGVNAIVAARQKRYTPMIELLNSYLPNANGL